jgi:hypothetical protein
LVTVLNLIWLLVAVAALGALLVWEHRRRGGRTARIQRVMAVLLVTVSLFPCVSASDDVINFAYVSAGLETRSGFGHSVPDDPSSNNSVIYLVLQNLEHLQVTTIYALLVAFCFFGFVFYSSPRSILRRSPAFVSRGPPQLIP